MLDICLGTKGQRDSGGGDGGGAAEAPQHSAVPRLLLLLCELYSVNTMNLNLFIDLPKCYIMQLFICIFLTRIMN